MPKLHLSIHVDQNGLQTINSDGDPSLWPLVGRLAACHSQAKMLALFAVLDSGGAQSQAAKTEAPPAREQGPVDPLKRSAEVEHLKEQVDLIDISVTVTNPWLEDSP